MKVGIQAKAHAKTYTEVFGEWLCDIAAADKKVVGITPAMESGSGLTNFAKEYPDRFFDVAIAEQHAVTFAAGLASDGMKPICAIYSTFSQRAFDQIVHDVALQKLPVLFPLDRGGIVGADGATHHGAFDLSFLRCVPNLVIMTPSDENETRKMLFTGYKYNGPAVVRYPRGKGPGIQIEQEMQELPLGKARVMRHSEAEKGKRVAFLAFGSMVYQLLPLAEELNATLIDMRFVKPLDKGIIKEVVGNHDLIVTAEENVIQGGAGSACLEAMAELGAAVSVLQVGIPDQFVEQGDNPSLFRECGLDNDSIREKILQRLKA